MTHNSEEIQDIFRGAEKIEILGKLPAFLWAYIDAAGSFLMNLNRSDHTSTESFINLEKLLQILDSAAEQLSNEALKKEIELQLNLLSKLKSHEMPPAEFENQFMAAIKNLEKIAGQRCTSPDSILDTLVLDKELQRAEKIKGGRSADIFISVDLLDEIRDYLTKEVLSEGISTVLVIDNAGTLIVNIGHKLDLDVVGLSAVAAANFAATEQIAKLIGEKDFVLLFYKGHEESFHFCRVGTEYIIVTIFDNALSLGLLRLKIAEVAQALEKKLPNRQG
jgi:predicted regulator of Ras-like GTPase activity (Roadblock/LC7/MglB family)